MDANLKKRSEKDEVLDVGETALEDNPPPMNKKNARSKMLSYWAIVIIGFALAIDYTMCMMSIQPLYYVVQGQQNLYGLVYGSYDLGALILVPFFGFWVDRTGKFKLQMMTGGVLNALGNLLYAFTLLISSWWPMLVGRLIAGMGSATLGIGSGYIAVTSTLQGRQATLATYRISQNIARVIGPFVGYLFLGFPNVDASSSTALKIFNWYSIPGWFAFGIVAILTVLFMVVFVNPTEENQHLVKQESPQSAHKTSSEDRLETFKKFQIWWLLLTFSSMFCITAQFSNVFGVFAGQYHGVQTQEDQWKTFIGTGIGAITGGLFYRKFIRVFPNLLNERLVLLVTNWLFFATAMMFIPWHGETYVPHTALFYAATGILAFGLVINATCLETVFSKKVTQYEFVIGFDNIVKNMSFYFMAMSAGRFAGPLVMGAVTQIATPSGNTFYCPVEQFVDGQVQCFDAPGSDTCSTCCAITGDYYYTEGCILKNSIVMYPILAGIQVVVNVLFHYVTWINWHYKT